MGPSLREFKEKFFNELIEIHWKHWSALGVSTHIKPERYWIIDLEALIISTLTIGLNDKRLLSLSLEWLIKNGEWLNLSRLKRIMNFFTESFHGMKEPLITHEIYGLLFDHYNKYAQHRITYKKLESYGIEDSRTKEYKNIFHNFKIRGVVTKPKPRDSSLLQILLRGFFGVDAHVETLIYLLVNDSGNSNFIAKEIFYNQKNLYTLLERWTDVEMVTKISGGKAASYSLNRKKEVFAAFELKSIPSYLNWTKTFIFLDRMAMALSTSPWSEDEYLLSSLFRDFSKEVKLIGKALSIKVPEPTSYLGKQYFTPFALGVLKMIKQLNKSS